MDYQHRVEGLMHQYRKKRRAKAMRLFDAPVTRRQNKSNMQLTEVQFMEERAAAFAEEDHIHQPRVYAAVWRRHGVCDICVEQLKEGAGVATCTFCPVVVHHDCLSDPDERASAQDKGWICHHCTEEFAAYARGIIVERRRRARLELLDSYQRRIASKWRALRVRRQYIAMKKTAVRIQDCVRYYLYTVNVRTFRRRVLRPLKLHIRCAKGLPRSDWENGLSDPYLVVTVIGPHGKQTWMQKTKVIPETLNPVWDETLLLPGVTAYGELLITVVDRDSVRDSFMGQARLPLGETIWKEGADLTGEHAIKFGPLEVKPRDAQGAHELQLDYTTVQAQPGASGSGELGTLELTVQTYFTPLAMCGYLLGPFIEYQRGEFQANMKKKRKRLYACQLDGVLHLFQHFAGSMRAQVAVPLRGTKVAFRNIPGDDFPHFIITTTEMRFASVHSVKPTEVKVEYDLQCPNKYEVGRWRLALMLGSRGATRPVNYIDCLAAAKIMSKPNPTASIGLASLAAMSTLAKGRLLRRSQEAENLKEAQASALKELAPAYSRATLLGRNSNGSVFSRSNSLDVLKMAPRLSVAVGQVEESTRTELKATVKKVMLPPETEEHVANLTRRVQLNKGTA
ncbi:unnamed protein product [Chrysoparadoxa australica]